jgi:hypothetical protein
MAPAVQDRQWIRKAGSLTNHSNRIPSASLNSRKFLSSDPPARKKALFQKALLEWPAARPARPTAIFVLFSACFSGGS